MAADKSLMQDVIYMDVMEVNSTAEQSSLNKSSLRVEEKSRSNNIADFLANDTEISLKRKSNIGDSGDVISIRGFESKRIMLNLDGRSISSTGTVGGNYVDFSTIPLDNIERIEIIKGGSSLEYGNNALGGVINAYTRKPTEEPSLNLYGTVGGWNNLFDMHNIRGSYAQKFGPVGLSLGVSHQEAEAFLRNNDYESFHLSPKLYVDMPWEGLLTLGYNYSRTKRGLIRSNRADGTPTSDSDPTVPGFDTSIDGNYPTASGEYFAGGAPTPSMTVIGEGANWIKTKHLFDVSYLQELTDNSYVEAMAYKNFERRLERNYADVTARQQAKAGPMDTFNPALTGDGDLVLQRDVTVDNTVGGKLKGGVDLGRHSLLAGVEYKILESGGIDIDYVDANYNKHPSNGWSGNMASSEGGPKAYVMGAFAGDSFSVTDRLLIDFGLRYDGFRYTAEDDSQIDESKVTPKLTVTYDVTDRQTATVAVYQNYRTPTIPELYWNTQASSSDNTSNVPYLKGVKITPETQTGVDVGYKYRFQPGSYVQLSGFYYSVEDYIMHKAVYVNRPPSNQNWAAYNVDALIYGGTLSARWSPLSMLTFTGSATLQKTKKDNDPADPDNVLESIDYIPDVKALFGVTWDIATGFVLDTTVNYVGERDYTINSSGLTKGTLDSYYTLGASLRYDVDEHTTLELYGDNLTDTDYEESWGYPAMGTNVGMSVRWKL